MEEFNQMADECMDYLGWDEIATDDVIPIWMQIQYENWHLWLKEFNED